MPARRNVIVHLAFLAAAGACGALADAGREGGGPAGLPGMDNAAIAAALYKREQTVANQLRGRGYEKFREWLGEI